MFGIALGIAACGGATQTVVDAASYVDLDAPSIPAADAGSALPDTGGASEAGTTSWTPTHLGTKLAFWLDPTSLVTVGGKVPRWSDLSGNGNNAVQPSTTWQPAYSANGIAGLPSATFVAPISFLTIPDSPSMRFGTSDCALFAVVRAQASSASNAMIYQKTALPPYDGLALFINSSKPSQTTLAAAQVSGQVYALSVPPPSTFADSTVHLLAARRAGASLEMRVDGAVSGSLMSGPVATVNVSQNGVPVEIGQNGYRTPQWNFQQLVGDIAEMIGVSSTLSPTDLASLEGYLKARYAIP
jgi:hypothetical protein